MLPLSYVVTAVLVASSTPDGVGFRGGLERTTNVGYESEIAEEACNEGR